MSRYDLSRQEVSRAELDQRSRASRLRLESLQRGFAVRTPVGLPPGYDGRPAASAAPNILPIPPRRPRRD